MDKSLITDIKLLLQLLYKGYRFDIKQLQQENRCTITVFRGDVSVSTISVSFDSPMTVVMDRIKAWMSRIAK